MKTTAKSIFVLLVSLVFLLTSCRKEDIEIIETPPEDLITLNSTVANLIQRTATNDGSNDNILDLANCFNIELPVTVTANSIEVIIYDEDDYDLVEAIFDQDDDDMDTLVISYPITIILSDYSAISINNATELNTYVMTCNGENVADDDIECIDFVYPISASVFNPNNELISTEIFSNDSELYSFIVNITDSDIVSINFPISVVLSNGSQQQINSLVELQNTIENVQDDCDEDDDYDYNDDDCNLCAPEQLESILTNCSDWQVDKLERDNVDYDDAYNGYDFNFFTNGTLSVSWNTTTVYGTWSASGTGNNITVVIDIPALTLCNNNWILHEIEDNGGETKVDLRLGDDDRLRYENTCN
ncbi:hypothetical protein [Psychroserpens sp. SPM9]|uniref:hypothetical protein n=1 Tax=Psychroserpens sp. SPM9 TaxID=2975598 RepID=UPI0021A7CCC8|nr:hypothetical protein [Psychroserpens sp. SPM9]MDG5492112.1 hypothetical protein [Psychroserpens sp. SPM9]